MIQVQKVLHIPANHHRMLKLRPPISCPNMHLITLNKVYQNLGMLQAQSFVHKTALIIVAPAISKESTPEEIKALYKENRKGRKIDARARAITKSQ